MFAQPIVMLLVAAAAWPLAAGAGVYKCTESGKVVYQDSPCESTTAQRQVTGRPEQATGNGAPPPAPEDRRRRDAIQSALMAKPFCDEAVPGFKQRVAAQYAAWRQRNAAMIQKIESGPDFREQLARYLDVRTAKMKAEHGVGMTCDDAMLDFMSQPARPR
jgi:uncharacterized protein DUF4124